MLPHGQHSTASFGSATIGTPSLSCSSDGLGSSSELESDSELELSRGERCHLRRSVRSNSGFALERRRSQISSPRRTSAVVSTNTPTPIATAAAISNATGDSTPKMLGMKLFISCQQQSSTTHRTETAVCTKRGATRRLHDDTPNCNLKFAN